MTRTDYQFNRRRLLTNVVAGGALVGLSPFLEACVAPAPASAAAKKVTVMIADFGNERFDTVKFVGNEDAMRTLHGFLVTTKVKDGRRVLSPGIASAWEVSSNGLSWTFRIRQGAKFHDGRDVTTEDVLWSLRHTIGPQAAKIALSGGIKTLAGTIDRIEQTGPDRVTVITKTEVADMPVSLSDAVGGAFGVVFPKRGALYDEPEADAYERNPIAAGPMKLVKHVSAELMSFERVDNFWDPDLRLAFSQLDLKLVPEEATRVAAISSGQADLAPVSLASRSQVESAGGRVLFSPEGAWFDIKMLGVWKKEFPFSDQRVREALNHALNKESFQKLFGGPDVLQNKAGFCAVGPSTLGYRAGLDPFPFDPNRARQLLADAGFADGKGFGKLVINAWQSATTPLIVESALLGADQWRKELKLDVEVRVGNETNLKLETKTTEKHLGTILWQDNQVKFDASSSLRNYYGRRGDPPDLQHHDPRLLQIAEAALRVFPTDAAREAALANAYKTMRDYASHIPIGYINIPWAVGKRVASWTPYPLASYLSGLGTLTTK